MKHVTFHDGKVFLITLHLFHVTRWRCSLRGQSSLSLDFDGVHTQQPGRRPFNWGFRCLSGLETETTAMVVGGKQPQLENNALPTSTPLPPFPLTVRLLPSHLSLSLSTLPCNLSVALHRTFFLSIIFQMDYLRALTSTCSRFSSTFIHPLLLSLPAHLAFPLSRLASALSSVYPSTPSLPTPLTSPPSIFSYPQPSISSPPILLPPISTPPYCSGNLSHNAHPLSLFTAISNSHPAIDHAHHASPWWRRCVQRGWRSRG